MFKIKYRYPVIILLAVYSYLNTLFSEVYFYYKISAPAWLILTCLLLITASVWESNRFLEKIISRFIKPANSIKFLIVFFISGFIAASVISIAFIILADHIFLHQPLDTLTIAMKLSLTYATRINLFMHIANVIFVFFKKYKTKELEAEELKRISAQAQLQAIKNQVN
ncbi:MAG: hypothetical protein ABJB05_04840, partial [Parafilimonas sp.]